LKDLVVVAVVFIKTAVCIQEQVLLIFNDICVCYNRGRLVFRRQVLIEEMRYFPKTTAPSYESGLSMERKCELQNGYATSFGIRNVSHTHVLYKSKQLFYPHPHFLGGKTDEASLEDFFLLTIIVLPSLFLLPGLHP